MIPLSLVGNTKSKFKMDDKLRFQKLIWKVKINQMKLLMSKFNKSVSYESKTIAIRTKIENKIYL